MPETTTRSHSATSPAIPPRMQAPAKINLTLHVTGRRPDGYHLLDSLVAFAGAHDVVTATPADTLCLTVAGPFAPALADDPDNLVLRAARALAEAAGVLPRAALHLDKRLPVASGIGGGSADAAATLRALSRLWGLATPLREMHAIAARLGADVPVCVASRACRMSGIGEILSPVPKLPACGLLLANPGVALATQAVFRARSGAFSPPLVLPDAWPDAAALAATLALAGNDLQPPAIALCPAIGALLAALAAHPGALLARMSGSGATCFALFATPAEAEAAAAALAQPGRWCWGGPLYDVDANTL